MSNFRIRLLGNLIGKYCEILDKGIFGIIVDETKNTFVIQEGDKKIRILKSGNTFLFYFDDCKIIVDGKILVGRPWERPKKKIKFFSN